MLGIKGFGLELRNFIQNWWDFGQISVIWGRIKEFVLELMRLEPQLRDLVQNWWDLVQNIRIWARIKEFGSEIMEIDQKIKDLVQN